MTEFEITHGDDDTINTPYQADERTACRIMIMIRNFKLRHGDKVKFSLLRNNSTPENDKNKH